ncbi:MAG TPA: cell division protein FtsL [Nitrospirota bacterium]
MNSRAGALGSLVLGGSRRGNLQWVLLSLVCITVLMLYVGGMVQIVRLGYQIEALEREKRELERANRSLLIEASSLTSPARIEELAVKGLGMTRPAKENVVIVKRKTPAK